MPELGPPPERDLRAELFQAVGGLTLVWAQIDVALDMALRIIHHSCGGALIQSKGIPAGLADRISYFGRAHARLSKLQPFNNAARDLVNEMRRLSGERHNIVHGAALRVMDDGSLMFFRPGLKSNGDRFTLKSYTIAEIEASATASAKLAMALAEHCRALAEAFVDMGGPTLADHIGGQPLSGLDPKR